MRRVAHEIVLNAKTGTIDIDGLRFPYYISENPEIEMMPGVAAVHIGIFADNVVFIDPDGEKKTIVRADQSAELAWARARAKEIVHEGLAPVLKWIEKGMPK